MAAGNSLSDNAGEQLVGALTVAGLTELQRFAEVGRWSASLLHEISNPLTAALLHLEQLHNKRLPGINGAWRDMQLLRSYVEAARQQLRQESMVTSFCLRPQLEQLKRLLRPLAGHARVQLVIGPVPHCRLNGDPVKFQHILANLIVNGIDAYRGIVADSLAKPVGVRFTHTGNWLTVRVTDWGMGIAPQHLSNIFEPFYTTKQHSGYGLGIGLAIVKQYVTADFYGAITVTSSRRHGTSFTLRLPATVCRDHASSKS